MFLIEMLKEAGIVKIKSIDDELFTLKSGKKSRLFIDIKQASLDPTILKEIVNQIKNYNLDDFDFNSFDVIASVAVGGVPIASVYSYIMCVPQIIVRTEKHDRGTKSQIIGDCEGKTCMLIEDVATSGGSIVNAVKTIREAGGICDTCIVIVSREEGAEELCKENNINLYPLLKKSDFGINEVNLK